MKVNLVGAVGGGNFGDEFILNCCIKEYYKINNVSISLSGFDEGFIVTDETCIAESGLNFFEILKELRVDYIIGKPVTLEVLTSKFDEFETLDAIHFIGGGYINNLWPSNYALLALAYVYSKINAIPIYATGLGLYPYIKDPDLIELFKSLSLIDVRDKKSKDYLPDASYTGDDALLSFCDLEYLSKQDIDAALIISLQSHLFEGKALIEKIFTDDVLNGLIKQKIKKIIIIEAAPEDNIPFPRDIFNHALKKGIEINFLTNRDMIKHGLPYNHKSFVISSRYHINLLYSMLGVEGVAVYQNDYYKNKHQSIIDMGGEWELISHEQLSNALNYWLPMPDCKKGPNMKLMADMKKELFSQIIANAPSKKEYFMSLESALALINKYITK